MIPDSVPAPAPQTVIYAGHMPDGRGAAARFPAEAEARVAEAAGQAMRRLAATGARTAVGSLAAGADLLLAEAALAAGMQVKAVLPGSLEVFMDASVRPHGPAWEQRLRKLLAHPAVTVETLGYGDAPLPDRAFAEVNDRVLALALGTAAPVSAVLVLTGGYRPDDPAAPGGTADFARALRQKHIAIQFIDPLLMESAPTASAQPRSAALPAAPDLNALLPEFDRLDGEAIVSQGGWRKSLHRMLLLFAALMVITGMEHMSDETLWGAGRALRIVAISATVLGLGFEAGLGLKPNRSHRAWVRSRSLAEAIRAAAWARIMGFPPLAVDASVEAKAQSAGLDELAAELAALPRKERWHWYATHRLRDQSAYYDVRAHRMHKLERKLLIARYTLIVLAMLYGILRLVSEFDTSHTIDPHTFHHYNLLGVAIALISLMHVWLESTQAERLAGRYKALARTLAALANKIEATDSEDVAQHIAREGEELLFAQNEEWVGVVG